MTDKISIEELLYRIHAHENDLTQMWTADYFLSVQKELLALKQATKNPVAYRNKFTGQFFTLEQQPDAVTDTAVYEPVFLAAPALPKQPVPMAFDEAWENTGHLFIDNKQYAALFCGLGYKAALAQPAIPEQPKTELVDLSQQVEILNRVLNWIVKELPVPTQKASAMAIRLSSVIGIISDLEVSAQKQK